MERIEEGSEIKGDLEKKDLIDSLYDLKFKIEEENEGMGLYKTFDAEGTIDLDEIERIYKDDDYNSKEPITVIETRNGKKHKAYVGIREMKNVWKNYRNQ